MEPLTQLAHLSCTSNHESSPACGNIKLECSSDPEISSELGALSAEFYHLEGRWPESFADLFATLYKLNSKTDAALSRVLRGGAWCELDLSPGDGAQGARGQKSFSA